MVRHGKSHYKLGINSAIVEGKRTTHYKIDRTEPLKRYYKNVWFLNDELVKFLRVDRKTNTVHIYVYDRQMKSQLSLETWLKRREMAFSNAEIAYLLKYSKSQIGIILQELRKRKMIPEPKYISLKDVNKMNAPFPGMYSETTLFKVREYLITHFAKPHKDGTYSGHYIAEQELESMIGKSLMLYTQTIDGKMIPVWRAV